MHLSKFLPISAQLALAGLMLFLHANVSAQTEAFPQPAAADAAPETVVVNLEQVLLHSMQVPELNRATRQQRLRPVVERVFNFPRMGRFIFGSRWRDFNSQQQQSFATAFTILTVATYAERFDRFNNERFIPVSVSELDARRAQVRHELITGSGERITFDYLLLREAEQWRIVNITTRGVSDLALKRTQYSKLFEEGGLSAVLDYMVAQTQRMTAS